jgi:diguanylate cyclase (GGDEF)-like protein
VQLINRRDASLATALLLSMIVMFNRPLRFMLDVVTDVEHRYDIDLLPALVVLAVTFGFHEYRKRRQGVEETQRVQTRSDEVERLLVLCRALAGVLDDSGLQQTLIRYLPVFCGDRSYWLLRRRRQAWDILLQDMTLKPALTSELLEERATRAVAAARPGHDKDVATDDDVCFPLMVGESLVGALGIRNTPELSSSERQALAAAASIAALTIRNLQVLQDAHERGIIDDLTGCMTRTAGLAHLDVEMRRARRTRRPLSILLLDIDQFKIINDTRGHLSGDLALESIGGRLSAILRASDVRCRLGGDEFLIILPDTPPEGLTCVAEKLRRGVAEDYPGRPDLPSMTISIGAVTAAAGEANVLALLQRADEALYRAKREGRNRVCLSEPTVTAHAPMPWSVRRQEMALDDTA